MAVLHLQMAIFSASGGGERPPAAPAAGVGGNLASGVRQIDSRDRLKSPKNEPIFAVFNGF